MNTSKLQKRLKFINDLIEYNRKDDDHKSESELYIYYYKPNSKIPYVKYKATFRYIVFSNKDKLIEASLYDTNKISSKLNNIPILSQIFEPEYISGYGYIEPELMGALNMVWDICKGDVKEINNSTTACIFIQK